MTKMNETWEQLKKTLLLKAKEVLRHEKAYLFAAAIDNTKPIYDTLTTTEIAIPFNGHVYAYQLQIVQHAGRHFKSSQFRVDGKPADKKSWLKLIRQIEDM